MLSGASEALAFSHGCERPLSMFVTTIDSTNGVFPRRKTPRPWHNSPNLDSIKSWRRPYAKHASATTFLGTPIASHFLVFDDNPFLSVTVPVSGFSTHCGELCFCIIFHCLPG